MGRGVYRSYYESHSCLFLIKNNPYCKEGKIHNVKDVDNCRRNVCVSKKRWDPVVKFEAEKGKESLPVVGGGK